MNALFLSVSLLLLVNCGQDTKTPAGPVQPEGPASWARIKAGFR